MLLKVKWFHLHIPKTAGSSLNAMLSDSLGDQFQNHNLEENELKAIFGSGHRTFRHIKMNWSDHRIVAILRDPIQRLRSELEHHKRRAERKKYWSIGHIVRAMAYEGFEVDEHLMAHPEIMVRCDNIMTRYLCSSRVPGRITAKHLDEAMTNLDQLDCVILNDEFENGVERLFSQLELPTPKIRYDNQRNSDPLLFEELPAGLESYVEFDKQLFEFAKSKFSSFSD